MPAFPRCEHSLTCFDEDRPPVSDPKILRFEPAARRLAPVDPIVISGVGIAASLGGDRETVWRNIPKPVAVAYV